ncbi:hypothetical protein PB2503_03692 [Parvularcula bermudensis HTCC2503]|uniref:Uncharacterized protein n=1 Tax=Parvularcula bermudensis (strain ATCC BAA-594 / HTCC2503 / KCTC 12087) TaxID=314260 RepID=E0TDZ2_PARBH|nr:hypothetical protein PB2503_03692 [Parvularcula bermudensis HTCC2503]
MTTNKAARQTSLLAMKQDIIRELFVKTARENAR